VVSNKGDARLEDEATVKEVRVADLRDARVEDEGILEEVDFSEKGDARRDNSVGQGRDAENEDATGVDDQSDVDDSGVQELSESEEERHRDDDDCFGSTNKSRRDITKLLERWKKISKERRRRKPSASAGVGAFETNSIGQNHDIDATYSTDELDSDVECEEELVHKYTTFQSEDMGKDFKFKVGMEFCLPKEFKQALKEYSVLHGREIMFVKNDDIRMRAVCKKKCGFLILYSKVGGSHTFRVKTLVDSHACGRVFGNQNANKDWVSKVVVEKFRNVGKMTTNEIIDDIKKTYSVGITKWRKIKGKQLDMDVLEGDGQKQYTMLYDYAVELKRVSARTTVKIKVNQPQLTLQPRFGDFYMGLEGCKEGFKNGSRPFIGVDGCHLKSSYGGQLLVAVAKDPND